MSHLTTTVAIATLLGLASAGLGACAPDADMLRRAASLPTYDADHGAGAPAILRVVGPVSGLVCNNRYDPAKGQAEALKQLQVRALQHGGDAVTDVKFTQVSNVRSPCWHGVEATGLAVISAR